MGKGWGKFDTDRKKKKNNNNNRCTVVENKQKRVMTLFFFSFLQTPLLMALLLCITLEYGFSFVYTHALYFAYKSD